MADDIIIRIGADTSGLDAAMQVIKQRGQTYLQYFTQPTQGPGGAAPPGAPFDPIAAHAAKWKDVPKENAAALEAYEDAAKKATGTTNQLSEATGRGTSQFERIFRRIAEGALIYGTLRFIIEQVTAAFQEASQVQLQFVQLQNQTHDAVGQTKKVFDDLKQASDESGQSLEKFITPAAQKLYEAGVSETKLAEQTKVLGQYLSETGIDLTQVAVKAREGSVGVQDIVKFGTALGGVWRTNALEFQKMVQQFPLATRDLEQQWTLAERQHTLLQRRIQDENRLRETQLSFADVFKGPGQGETLGKSIADQAMDVFKEHGTFGSLFSNIQVAGLPPGFGDLANKQITQIQSQLRKGMGQIMKEEGYSEQDVQLLARAGYITSQMVMDAAKRSKEQELLVQQREHEDQVFEHQQMMTNRQIDLEKERYSWNDKINGVLEERKGTEQEIQNRIEGQARIMDTVVGQQQKFNNELDRSREKLGDINNLIYNPKPFIPGQPTPAGQVPTETPGWLDFRVREQWQRLHPGQPSGTGTPTGGTQITAPKIEENTGKTVQNLEQLNHLISRLVSD